MHNEWVDILAKRLGTPLLTTRDEVRFNCWREDCGASGSLDTKHHLYVNPVEEKYFCHRCQRGGSLESLSKALGITPPGYSPSGWDKFVRSLLEKPSVSPISELDPVPLEVPEEYVEMIPGTKAHSYLLSRGITDEMIRHYRIGLGLGFLRNRVVFLDVNSRDEVVYWVARDYSGSSRRPKYRNADAPRDNQVFNLGRLERDRYRGSLVVCEGPISAIAAGYNAVATYGKYVTKAQLSRLVNFRAEEYVIAGDGDGQKDANLLATRLSRKGARVRFVRMTGTDDPASVDKGELLQRLCEAPVWTPFTVLDSVQW